MCMSCGCGEHNERHKPGDIILDDLRKAAKNSDGSVEKVADNIQASVKQLPQKDKAS